MKRIEILAPLPPARLTQLDGQLLDDRGLLRPLPAAGLKAIPVEELRAWLHLRAVYLFPTLELVEWLRATIGNVPAIEIGAGNGALGRALGIPRTDSRIQAEPEMIAYLTARGQPAVVYPPDVRRLDALEAIRQLRPHTVIAAWVTQLATEADPATCDGCAFGVNEATLIRKVRRYIFVGNLSPHGQKRILSRAHETHAPGWIVSRGDPALDRIWIWRGAGFR